jgi:arabinan endo-1,5-alpha-L-arabinosidase
MNDHMRHVLFFKLLFLLTNAGYAQATYTNPVYKADFADPTVIRGHDGWFYAYATNTSVANTFYHIQVAKSSDLVHWKIVGDALPVTPTWADKDFWAPHVLYDSMRQRYYMYYSGESPDDKIGKCIGVAISKNPEGPFVDIGQPLISGESFVNIDPMAFDDRATGKKYLYWGSGHKPIKVRELSDDRISFKAGSTAVDVITPNNDDYSKLVEGAWVHYRDGYYYMFYSGDNCCGDKANYAMMVARSRSAQGPFERLSEAQKTNSSAILVKNKVWLAPGHNSVITDEAGQDWIVYHAIALDPVLKSRGRIMLIDRLHYKNGWPFIETMSPSTKPLSVPFIKKNNLK